MTPTTEQLKDLLAKVTQGAWYVDGAQVTSDNLHEVDCIVDHVYGPDANATLIALAPTLAAEVVRLRDALTRLGTARCFGNGETLGMSLLKDPLGREILSRMEFARQALDATAHNRQ